MLGLPPLDQSEVDRLLALALSLHDKDLCPGGCGGYLDDTCEVDGWHEVHKVRCDRCAARDSDTDKPEPGELRYAVDTRP